MAKRGFVFKVTFEFSKDLKTALLDPKCGAVASKPGRLPILGLDASKPRIFFHSRFGRQILELDVQS